MSNYFALGFSYYVITYFYYSVTRNTPPEILVRTAIRIRGTVIYVITCEACNNGTACSSSKVAGLIFFETFSFLWTSQVIGNVALATLAGGPYRGKYLKNSAPFYVANYTFDMKLGITMALRALERWYVYLPTYLGIRYNNAF